MNFNGVDSYINCGTPDTLIGDKTFAVWIKVRTLGESSTGRIIDGTKFIFSVYNNSVLVTSNAFGSSVAPSFISYFGQWANIVVTRTASGITNFYVNGVLNGAANQNSGTPEASSVLYIGENSGGTRAFDGKIASVKIYNGILSTQEITQMYTSEKNLYNL